MTPGCCANGELFLYDEDIGLAAFEVGGRGAGDRALVCVGGLTDGLLSLRYLPGLAAKLACDADGPHCGWRVVQPVLQSSYRGWGVGSLEEDVKDLDRLLQFLIAHRGIRTVALLGHSTGCQDVVRYLAEGTERGHVAAAVLQAPVSDREALEVEIGTDASKAIAYTSHKESAVRLLASGQGKQVLPAEASDLIGPPHPVSAYRFHSLSGRMTDDDMFSSDLTADELRIKLGHIAVPTLLAVSLDDEYVPASVDARALAFRVASAIKGQGDAGASAEAASAAVVVEVLALPEGGHALRAPAEASAQFCSTVSEFLRRNCPA